VTNCATSGLAKHLATKFNFRCLQSAVGEANVADLMIAEGAVFGGEGNGGPIDPQVGFVRDSFVGMARILELMATSGKTVSELVAELPPLAMVKDKTELSTAALPLLFKELEEKMPDAQVSRLDGLKLQWPDRWLLVRGSNTEPIVRFMAEAPTTADAQALCEQARTVAVHLSS
jgi:phosphomannomutase